MAALFFVSNQVAKYTSEKPVELPTVTYTTDQLRELETRIETFVDAVNQGAKPEHDLVLTADEINALIAKENAFRGKVFIRIKDGQITGEVSIPTDQIPGGNERYLNATATLEAALEAGVLIVTLADAEVNGEAVPDEMVDALSRINLAKELNTDSELAKKMRKFKAISIEDGKIVFKVDRDQDASPEAP